MTVVLAPVGIRRNELAERADGFAVGTAEVERDEEGLDSEISIDGEAGLMTMLRSYFASLEPSQMPTGS